ncbi:MAG: hypothetical protein FJ267_20165, partial [Planctomycetes bacterium]|nr:hypothetical protein [Planctomycetota bacterium]
MLTATNAFGQLVPEIGFVHPAGAKSGSTVDVILGGYDWTPDMQLFVHDPRIKVELTGPPSKVLVPDPPYWFGFKARGNAWPLPREFPARLTIPSDVPPGIVRWQVANANGASPPGFLVIGDGSIPEVSDETDPPGPIRLPSLPITVCGQIRRIEEIDRYQFQVPQSGPITIDLMARRIGSPLHVLLKVIDPDGKTIVDAADTEGKDFTVSMLAEANKLYEVRLHDHDFAGDRSYVYRMTIT